MVRNTMLRFYDSLKPTKLLAMAAAGGLFLSASAAADVACDLSDGYATGLPDFALEMQACVETTDAERADLAEAIGDRIAADRQAHHLKSFATRDSLTSAAIAHGLDMSVRKYADHLDLEGRDHLYRIGTLDRTQLTGATGANVLITPANIDADALYDEIRAEQQNRANILNSQFTHTGIGIVEAGNRLFVTVLFTQMEGELNQALPLIASGKQRIRATFDNPQDKAIGWTLTEAHTQKMLAQGLNPLLNLDRLEHDAVTHLDIHVTSDTFEKSVRGPMVSAD